MPWHWSIVSPQFAAALIFLTLGAWHVWRRVRRRRQRAATASAIAVTVLSLATLLTLVNAYFAYLPRLGDVTNLVTAERGWPDYAQVAATAAPTAQKRWPQGVTTHLSIPDNGSGFGQTKALVYLPPQYFSDSAVRLPVVYLFHGSPGVPGDWFRGGQAADAALRLAHAGRPVIIVAPRMSHGWLDDPECVDGVNEKVETHLLADVIPTVDASLRTVASRDGRTFGGMSAGGYCALNLGLRNRAVVSSIIDMSGFTRPTHTGGLGKVFGSAPASQRLVYANSPAASARALPPGPTLRIWMDSGDADRGVLADMRAVIPALRTHGITVEFRIRAGAHTFQVWVPALDEALPWSQGLPPGTAPHNPSHQGSLSRKR